MAAPALTGHEPIAVPSSMKVTVPALGVPVFGGTTSTVAVNVIAWPTVPDVVETLKAVEVGIPAITVTELLPLIPECAVSVAVKFGRRPLQRSH